MALFNVHTVETAPEGSKAVLEKSKHALGFIPNLYATMAESPSALNAYTAISEYFENSSLSRIEQQIVALTASVVNGCEFCVAAHSVIAKKMVGVDMDIVDAIREQKTIPDSKLEALAEFTRTVVNERGWVNGKPVENFIAAGFTKAQALDVILGVTLKTLSYYSNHLTETTTNEAFMTEAWQKK